MRRKYPENPFFARYKELKRTESWEEIIKEGEQLISNEEVPLEVKRKIYIRLAENYFYLGEYEKSRDNAFKAKDIIKIKQPQDVNLLAKTYYLIAAACKGLYENALEDSDKKLLTNSMQIWIEEALSMVKDPDIKENIIGKIHYKAGAIYQDIYKNFNLAEQYIYKAMQLFSNKDNINNNYQMADLRCNRLSLDLGYINCIDENYSHDTVDVKNFRNHVHRLQLSGEIKYLKGNHVSALTTIDEAIKFAEKLSMKQEIKRSESLKTQIFLKKPDLCESESQFQDKLDIDGLTKLSFQGRSSF